MDDLDARAGSPREANLISAESRDDRWISKRCPGQLGDEQGLIV
jgi:hypothetical protein